MSNQERVILAHLRGGRPLTVGDALTKYGIYALSQRIGDLKREGYPITSEMVKLPNGKRVAQYRLA